MDNKRDKRWRIEVKKKCFGRCVMCGNEGIEVHHIFSRGIKKLKYIVENGLFLCFNCHRAWENPRNKNKLIKKYIGWIKYKKLENIKKGMLTVKEANFTEVR